MKRLFVHAPAVCFFLALAGVGAYDGNWLSVVIFGGLTVVYVGMMWVGDKASVESGLIATIAGMVLVAGLSTMAVLADDRHLRGIGILGLALSLGNGGLSLYLLKRLRKQGIPSA